MIGRGQNNPTRFFRYVKEYRWSNILAMIRNSRLGPKICREDFRQKLVVITGATSGIGYHTARKFAAHGANLLCINRNPRRSDDLRREIEAEFGVRCDVRIADLSRIPDIVRVSNDLTRLAMPVDVLIHNAGIYLTRRESTPEGLEKVFAVHYLASFVMNLVLREKLMAQGKARILIVGSEGHRFAAWGLRLDDVNWEKRIYTGLRSYGSAKTAQLLSMIVFNESFQGSGVTINAMHPGAVKTGYGRENGPVYQWLKRNIYDKRFQSPDISAEALYYLGVSKEVEGVSGKFFNLTTEEDPAPPARDREAALELSDKTLELLASHGVTFP